MEDPEPLRQFPRPCTEPQQPRSELGCPVGGLTDTGHVLAGAVSQLPGPGGEPTHPRGELTGRVGQLRRSAGESVRSLSQTGRRSG